MKPTEAQIRELEKAHKMMLVDLVLANKLFLSLLPKLKGKKTDSKEYKAVHALGLKIVDLVKAWYIRQRNYEVKAGIPKADPNLYKYFLTANGQRNLVDQAKKYMDPSKPENQIMGIFGIGIIPLIIWAVIIIAAAYTAVQITNDLTTTSEEKADLLKQTQATLKDLNITGPQAAAIITQTQAEASNPTGEGGFFSSIKTLLLWGGVGLIAVEVMKHKNKAVTKAA